MQLIHFFGYSLYSFSKLYYAKFLNFWKIVLYAFFLALILIVPTISQLSKSWEDLRQHSEDFLDKVPNFEIKDSRLFAEDTTGFIYQTDSIIFIFDPEGKRSEADITTDNVGSLITIALLPTNLLIVLPESGPIGSMFETNTVKLSYSEQTFQNLNRSSLETILENLNQSWLLKSLFFVFLFYFLFLNLGIDLLLITLFSRFFVAIWKVPLNFLDCFKISTISATLPALITSVIQLTGFQIQSTFFLLSTFFIFTLVTRKKDMFQKRNDPI